MTNFIFSFGVISNFYFIFSKSMSQITPVSNQKPISLDKIINSTVLVRVSFDIPNLSDIERISDAIPTIKQLLEQNNKLILCTKWGKVKEKVKINEMQNHPKSTNKLVSILNQELQKINLENVLESEGQKNKNEQKSNPISLIHINQFAFDFEELAKNLEQMYFSINSKTIILLENTHFDEQEKSKNQTERLEIAGEYTKLADFFVDEAFASSHRLEATNTEIKTLLPYALGLSYANEVANLEKLKNPKKPFIVLMGGAKLETKLPLLEKILPLSDKILVAGLLAFTFIKAARLNAEKLGEKVDLPEIFDSMVEEDFVPNAQELLKKFSSKIILPIDFIYDEIEKNGETKKLACDIGENTIAKFGTEIKLAKTLFWNGPMGFFEKKPFDKATFEIAKIITQSQCFSVLGGGDTNAALGAEILSKFGFVSMAGGATLDFLSR